MKNTNRSQIHDELAARIRSGVYAYGDGFPGVNALMAEFSASYVTACRILRSLADEGYLLCRSRTEGYTVCYIDSNAASSAKKVNFITEDPSRAFGCHLFTTGKEIFEKAGWEVRLHATGKPTKIEKLLEILNEPDTYSVIVGIDVPWQRFIATLKHLENRVLIIGRISKNDNISTVVCDEAESVRRIIGHLGAAGRSRPALVVHDAKSELENLRIAAWRQTLIQNGMDLSWIEEHIWRFDEPVFGTSKLAFYRQILKEHGREIDSLVIPSRPGDCIRALKSLGLETPREILLVTVGEISDKSLSGRCGIHHLDNNPHGHLELALKVMEYRYSSGKRECGYWFFCPPGDVITPEAGQVGKSRGSSRKAASAAIKSTVY